MPRDLETLCHPQSHRQHRRLGDIMEKARRERGRKERKGRAGKGRAVRKDILLPPKHQLCSQRHLRRHLLWHLLLLWSRQLCLPCLCLTGSRLMPEPITRTPTTVLRLHLRNGHQLLLHGHQPPLQSCLSLNRDRIPMIPWTQQIRYCRQCTNIFRV